MLHDLFTMAHYSDSKGLGKQHPYPKLLSCFGGAFEDTIQISLSLLFQYPAELLDQSRACCAHL